VVIALLNELVASETHHHQRQQARSLSARERYEKSSEMERARDRACARPRDPTFRAWAAKESKSIKVIDEESAAEFLRDWCGIKSRAEIATDHNAYLTYLRLEAKFEVATGRRTLQLGEFSQTSAERSLLTPNTGALRASPMNARR
jgi:hypothetical protein